MREILMGMEEQTLLFHQAQKQNALSSLRWLFWQCVIFGGLGTFFLVSPLFGMSIWNLVSATMYFGFIAFVWWRIRPFHIRMIWRANRRIAQTRIRMRRLDQELFD